ncbi:uncharacterized protein DS421_8g231750 [Arachis hypogaea]|nr:uncharacterized protein DS421_8g231750 [Arachis hypogaea]
MGMNGSSCWHKYRQTTFISIFILFAASSTSLFMAQGRAMSNVIEVSQGQGHQGVKVDAAIVDIVKQFKSPLYLPFIIIMKQPLLHSHQEEMHFPTTNP